MSYLSHLAAASNRQAKTENGAVSLYSSNSPLVDFFALAGATRGQPEVGLDLFKKALAQDRQMAVRLLFYMRDIRGGQGERQLFRNCLSYLAEYDLQLAQNLLKYVPEYGRYDDIFAIGVNNVFRFIDSELKEDIKLERPSLLAKWLPSTNTSSKVTRALAKELHTLLGISASEYRRTLSYLRKKIKLVEQQMSAREFGGIDYSTVPSQAALKYRKAFLRNDEARYNQYLASVTKGEQKINAGTLYPYQIYNVVGSVGAEELWKALPDYTMGKNALVVADVSGSMAGEPMSVSVSLALYFAERNKGIFKDHFITFSGKPKLQKIQGLSIRDKFNSIQRSEWEMNTNLNAVFKLLLDTAVLNNSDQSEMPETIYVISDMEFDHCGADQTNLEKIQEMYSVTKYRVPNIVFWNVRARTAHVPENKDTHGITLVSGYSPSVFKMAVENKTAEQLMLDVVNSERYSNIIV